MTFLAPFLKINESTIKTPKVIFLTSAYKRSFEVVLTERKQTWRCDRNHKTQFFDNEKIWT